MVCHSCWITTRVIQMETRAVENRGQGRAAYFLIWKHEELWLAYSSWSQCDTWFVRAFILRASRGSREHPCAWKWRLHVSRRHSYSQMHTEKQKLMIYIDIYTYTHTQPLVAQIDLCIDVAYLCYSLRALYNVLKSIIKVEWIYIMYTKSHIWSHFPCSALEFVSL